MPAYKNENGTWYVSFYYRDKEIDIFEFLYQRRNFYAGL